jgi:DNA-binding XRE family transcriptional regulator
LTCFFTTALLLGLELNSFFAFDGPCVPPPFAIGYLPHQWIETGNSRFLTIPSLTLASTLGSTRAEMKKSISTREYDAFLHLLRQVREEAGLTQIQLALALKKTQSFISKVERGETRLDIIQLRTVLGASQMSLLKFAQRLEKELSSMPPSC